MDVVSPFPCNTCKSYKRRLPFFVFSAERMPEHMDLLYAVSRNYKDKFRNFCVQCNCNPMISRIHSEEMHAQYSFLALGVLSRLEVRVHLRF